MSNTKDEKSFMSKIFKLIYYFIIAILCLFVLLIIFYLVSSKLNNKEDYKPKLSMYTIVSPSMTPVINVYDVVVNVRPSSEEDIQIGDIITYISKDPSSEGMMITHRVTEITTNIEGKVEYRTQGDNNEVPDSLYVPFESVVGKEIVIIPYLGKVQFLLANKKGWLILLLIPIIILLLKDSLKLAELFGLRKKVDRISGVITQPAKNQKLIQEQERKQNIKDELAIKEFQKQCMVRSSKEPSGFLDKYNETIITVKENKYTKTKSSTSSKVSISLSPKSKNEILDLPTIKRNNKEKNENKELNNKIQEYNVKIEELNKMLLEIDNINKKNISTKKTNREEAEELIKEEFLMGNYIRVTNIEPTNRGMKKVIKEEIPIITQQVVVEQPKDLSKTVRLRLNPNEIKKINRKNKTGTLKPVKNTTKTTKTTTTTKTKPTSKTSLISIVKK